MFLDAFLAPPPEFVPMPGMPADPFVLPPLMASSSGGSGGLDGMSGSGGGGATSTGRDTSSAPAPAAPAPSKGRGGGGGGRKELSEEQKERIRAKNRRWVGACASHWQLDSCRLFDQRCCPR
jgi:hypothetical protein